MQRNEKTALIMSLKIEAFLILNPCNEFMQQNKKLADN